MLQNEAFEVLKSGENVFLTGAAGTGKTFLIREFITYMKKENIRYAVTASTGIAATHLDGVTVHSWSGIGIKNKMSVTDIRNINKRTRENYKTAQVLIIDEISMLHGTQLDLIDIIARSILDENKPFGGLQVVLCGDFCQLPPVSYDNKSEVVFAYEARAWVEGNFKTCYLHQQHRQNTDDGLLDILNLIRMGHSSSNIKEKLDDVIRFNNGDGNTQSVRLYTTNLDVDEINKNELAKIDSPAHTYTMREYGKTAEVSALKKRCLAKEVLELKVGSPVLFIQNDQNKRYVNGTLGVVQDFTSYDVPIVKTYDGDLIHVTNGEWKVEDPNGKILACIAQLPLCLAWAITVHKSQGMTLDACEVDLSKAFAYGMGYVALSRVKSLSGLKLLGYNHKAIQIDPKMLTQDKIFKGEKSYEDII